MFAQIYRRGYLAINYRLPTLWKGRLARFVRPTSILILLTNRCNARCVHCDIWKNRGKEDTLSLPQWQQLLSDIRSWLGPLHVLITGGEALLNRDASSVLAHGASIGLWMEFLTNGYWDDQSRLEGIARARPKRVTISLDGIGDTHSLVRGKPDFWEKTSRSIETLLRLRREERLGYGIRLKTVIMDQNVDALADVADYARSNDVEVLYQAIEQNYSTPEDPHWYEHAPTWPKNVQQAVDAVDGLLALRRDGYPIVNSEADFASMNRYFRDPASYWRSVQAHTAHEQTPLCAGLGNMQIEPNGDVLCCPKVPIIGNVRQTPLALIWKNRPPTWVSGCCLTEPSLPLTEISTSHTSNHAQLAPANHDREGIEEREH